jgi:polyisoprenyl-phosphate glycosyltransferase
MAAFISVVVPVYGCTDCLIQLHQRLVGVFGALSADFEIIFINDASPDGAWGVIRSLCASDPRVKGIDLSRNFGQHYAISAGLGQAKGDYIVVMDCDLQDDPSEIPRFFGKMAEGYDAVLGRRSQRRDSWLKRASSKVFYRLLGFLTDSKLDGSVANFGMYRAVVIKAVNSMGDKIRFFPLMVQWVGFKTTGIEIQHSDRLAGKTSYTWGRLLKLAANVAITFSNKPLGIIIGTGFAISSGAMLYAAVVVWKVLNGGVTVVGWSSVIISLWFLGGAQMIVAGIVGLYVGRIFEATKARPLYLVRETLNLEKGGA